MDVILTVSSEGKSDRILHNRIKKAGENDSEQIAVLESFTDEELESAYHDASMITATIKWEEDRRGLNDWLPEYKKKLEAERVKRLNELIESK